MKLGPSIFFIDCGYSLKTMRYIGQEAIIIMETCRNSPLECGGFSTASQYGLNARKLLDSPALFCTIAVIGHLGPSHHSITRQRFVGENCGMDVGGRDGGLSDRRYLVVTRFSPGGFPARRSCAAGGLFAWLSQLAPALHLVPLAWS